MSFNPNIPQPLDRYKSSQAQFLENFSTLPAMLQINHILGTFVNPAVGDEGKHLYITMPEVTTDPTTGPNEAAVFAVQGNRSKQSELAFRRESNGSSYTWTQGLLNPNDKTFGWNRLPSGLLIKWGQFTYLSASAPATALNYTYPTPTNAPVFSVQFFVLAIASQFTQPGVILSSDPETSIEVTDISNPTRFTYAPWSRHTPGSAAGGFTVPNSTVNYIAFGLGV